jgi:histidinol-phosphatase (PHP family)
MIYKTDYHIHSTFSDGRSIPEDYISAALSKGLQEVGFSEHLTLFKEKLDWSMSAPDVPAYLSHIKQLIGSVNGIQVRTGLEVDYFPGKETETSSFLMGLDLDYIIGSVHFLGDSTVDTGPEFYNGKKIDDLYELYFNQVIAAAASGLFDIIAHCDLIRIYGFKPSADPEKLYRKLARSFRMHDVTFEVNTNGRNRPVGDFYPDRKYLKIFREENVPVCVNSDAHLPSRIAQHFDEAYQLLQSAGYTEMAVFQNRERYMIPFDPQKN